MYNNFINFLKFTKLNHSIKNLLIIFPVLASGIPINEISITIFYKGFLALVFLFMESIIGKPRMGNMKDNKL